MPTVTKFAKLFSKKNVFGDIESSDKQGLLKEMVNGLKEAEIVSGPTATEILKALMKREKIGSTGIGNGVAIPHAKIDKIKEMVIALGRSNDGIEYESVDGELVHIIFMVVSPKDEAELHLDALKWVSKLARNKDFCTFFRRATTVREIQSLLREMGDS